MLRIWMGKKRFGRTEEEFRSIGLGYVLSTKPAVVLYILILLPVNEAEGCWLTPRVKKELEAGERGWSPPGGRGTSLTHEK